ncbi:MAG TPA: DUF2442 domain-containing protein [Phototrophicaceae bacterium]|nr:DUF2442 domain-containing protein [Phototrophicaceae bacterium]
MTVNDLTPNDANRPIAVEISDQMLRVTLADGRIIATPLMWYPRLKQATPEQLQAYELSPAGIHWDQLDEDLSVVGMLQGHRPRDRKVKA